MAYKKRKRRLLFQITAIVLPLFLVLSVAAVWMFYNNTIDSYTSGQSARIKEELEKYYEFMQSADKKESDLTNGWYLDYWENNTDKMREEISLEEQDRLFTESEDIQAEIWSYDWLISLPDDLAYCAAKIQYDNLYNYMNDEYYNKDYEKNFLLDTNGDYTGMVLCEYDANKKGHNIGERYDIDLSAHKALQQAINSNTEDIVYELSEDFPEEGSYYMAYKPLVINGETRAVFGIAYNWNEFRDDIGNNFLKTLIFLIAGIAVIMIVLLFFLNKKAIRPTVKIQDALVEYTDGKDTKQIVKKMYEIKAKNELGYLADVISDLALEIDHYTKETARIAAEKERAQKELYEAEVKIMVSQIRPHFLYNALTSIAMLCELDPKTAKEATIAFSKYLRGNMDSLKQTKAVPFEQELSHIKNYLFIEKLRFDDLLNIEYDIQTTDFEVPQLSIQPLVENAVKHGVGMAEDGGTVTISTRETDDAFEVIISDDGVGFDVNAPKKDDGRSHIGMENTRKRLKEMCGADIIIESEVGKGTTARVIIPKEWRNGNEDTVS